MRASPLLTALTLLVVAAALVFTLSPFDFAFPASGHFYWRTSLSDVSTNIALFLPIGFLLRMLRQNLPRRMFLPELAAGAALSLGIESAQLYLATRHSQYSDILCNAAGAWLGAGLAHLMGRWLKQAPGECASLPFYGLLLMTPFPWLDGLGSHFKQILPSLPLALAGSLSIGAFTACLAEESRDISPATASLLGMTWGLLIFFPFLGTLPAPVLWSSLALGVTALLSAWYLGRSRTHGDELVQHPFRRITMALLVLGLFTGILVTAQDEPTNWHWNLALLPPASLFEHSGIHLVSRALLFLLLGYFYGSSTLETQRGGFPQSALLASLPLLVMFVLLSGWLARPVLSLAELPLLSFCFAYGAFLDRLRREAFCEALGVEEPPVSRQVEHS